MTFGQMERVLHDRLDALTSGRLPVAGSRPVAVEEAAREGMSVRGGADKITGFLIMGLGVGAVVGGFPEVGLVLLICGLLPLVAGRARSRG